MNVRGCRVPKCKDQKEVSFPFQYCPPPTIIDHGRLPHVVSIHKLCLIEAEGVKNYVQSAPVTSYQRRLVWL